MLATIQKKLNINKMRLIQLILFILLSHCTFAQHIYKYEQKISPSNNLEFKEISFLNIEEEIQLSGTFIYPKDGYEKIIMIIPGSGKDTRHSHFKLAENFLANNIAVFRFDDKGIGKSNGKFDDSASSLIIDVVFAYRELKNRKKLSNKKIGILGHSLGGIASIGAYKNGCDFDFLIQMATPVENNGVFLKYQATTMIDGWAGVKNKSPKEVVEFLEELENIILIDDDFKTTKKKAKTVINQLDFKKGRHIVNPIIIDLMKQKHENTYQTCKVPILFIIGSEDRHVSCKNEILTLERLGNPNIETKIIKNVDHYLTDKQDPRYLINTTAMNEIINWTLKK